MKIININFICLVIVVWLLSGCTLKGGWLTTVGSDYRKPILPTPSRWNAAMPVVQTPVAHGGKVLSLKNWWAGFNDIALNRLLDAAQKESASVANAKARIEQARTDLIGTDSQFLPSLDANLAASRSNFSFGGTPFKRSQYQIGFQSSWEIDLFGGLARQQEASHSHLESSNASWHDARVAVAAEVADAYLAFRYCEIQVQLAQSDASSREASAELLAIAGNAGFRSPAEVALANASAAEGNKILIQRQGQCERSIKGLVAITAINEPELRRLLAVAPTQVATLPSPPSFQIDAIPATILQQRPDVAAAERDMAEASAKIGVEQANRFPKVSLSGNITPVLQNINGAALTLAETWSIGPTISLPLFDAGKRAAKVDAAKAQYEAALSQYRATARTAIKEVEEALVRLHSVELRLPHAVAAVTGYTTSFESYQKLFEVGLGNLIDVETARRNKVAADLSLKELEQERVSAWIALYRAAGGSWQDDDTVNPKVRATTTQPLEKRSHESTDLSTHRNNESQG
ncbi:MAG: efflux transporter outer membrane subunit [Methyloglobulus sp.]|nr:efflux transporter outer membrane subunit [Methyloglobulus sp.]